MQPHDPYAPPDDLPAPEDDGAARHPPGLSFPALALPSTQGGAGDLRASRPDCRLRYPRTAVPGEPRFSEA